MELRHRPTFVLDVPEAFEVVQARLRAELGGAELEVRWARPPGARDEGLPANHLILTHGVAHRSFWSPWLNLELEPISDEETRLQGKFSPHPSVWTGFAFAYLGLGALSLFAMIFGFAQWSLGHSPWALWVLAGTGATMLGLWWSAQVGKRLARGQMVELRTALHEALGLRPDHDPEGP